MLHSLANRIAVCTGVLFLCFFAAASLQTQVSATDPTIVVVEKSGNHKTITVDSVQVNDILAALGKVSIKGKNHPLIVIVDSRLPAEEMWNICGIAGKAQLDNLRYFVHFRETKVMVEIKMILGVPFTTDPSAFK